MSKIIDTMKKVAEIHGKLSDQTSEIREMVEELARECNRRKTPKEIWEIVTGYAECLGKPVDEVLALHLESAKALKMTMESGQH